MIKNFDDIINELEFTTSLSGGSGGQHVNKTETKVNLFWQIEESNWLNDIHKERVFKKLQNRINQKGEFRLSCSETRSQHQNKKILIQRFQNILEAALAAPKKRKSTFVPNKAKLKRLKEKHKQAEKKTLRKKPDY
jgi:ribosome-associated protein